MPVNPIEGFENEPILTAVELLKHRTRKGDYPRFQPPAGVIFCYQTNLLRAIRKRHPIKNVKGFFGDLYLLTETQGKVAVAGNFGIGAPVAVVLLEDLTAFGVKRFISIGMAGGLQKELQAGNLVLCDRAIRDEGTSLHYLDPAKYVLGSQQIIDSMTTALNANGEPHMIGTSWTTDAPYREMRDKVEQYQREGVMTVEMEAAALFAAGQHLGVQVGAAFSIGDSLANLQWQLDFDLRKSYQGLEKLFMAALVALQTR